MATAIIEHYQNHLFASRRHAVVYHYIIDNDNMRLMFLQTTVLILQLTDLLAILSLTLANIFPICDEVVDMHKSFVYRAAT